MTDNQNCITYLKGDATNPKGNDQRVIVHICNDIGKWGKGFVLAISKRWKSPEAVYRAAFSSRQNPGLGEVQFITVDVNLVVANIIGQSGIRSPSDTKTPAPIRYAAVRKGLQEVAEFAKKENASVHMPRIGCGLAGGRWEEIEPIIIETLVGQGIDVCVYDF